ncbi:MAG TPA: hypothetical protein VGM75_03375 [Pseudonocardiaceae bacterium]
MDYRWRYADAKGDELTGPVEKFTGQVEAEDWLSANWQDLFDAGVQQVTLLEDEEELYGPMSLLPADES